MDDHQIKEEENESVGELSTACSQIVLECVYSWLKLVDLIFYGLWTNLLVRSRNGQKPVTNVWHARSLTFFIHVKTGNIVMWETQTAQQCRLGLFQDSDFAGDLEDSKSTTGGILCILGSHTFVPISWMCKKQTSVSHSSREAEIISLDAGFRMDGIPALTLWDLVIQVFHSVSNRTDGPKREPQGKPSAVVKPNMHNPIPIKHINVIPTNIDHIPSSTTHPGSSAMLYVFEDNEAVSKMIIKGRSRTMRHVSRTHRVVLDGLFDRINLDPKIQIRYIDTKHQLADMLTKGNFTRDEWNNLLHLFNTSHFSSTCCTKNLSLISRPTVANRIQDQKEEERVVSKSRPAAIIFLNLRQVPPPHRVRLHLKVREMSIASVKPHSRMSIESNSFDAASTSQVRLKDAYLGGLREKQRGNRRIKKKKKIQKTPTILRLRSGTTKGNPLPQTVKLRCNPLHTEPVLQLTRKVKRIRKRHGTTTFKNRRTHRTTRKPSSPWLGRSMENQLAILWKTLMWIWLFGEYSWMPLFKQRFISEKTATWI